jgi:hypothetical protein
MAGSYEIFYGEDGKWGVWRFIMNFEDMDNALSMANRFNEEEESFLKEFEAEGGENDTN